MESDGAGSDSWRIICFAYSQRITPGSDFALRLSGHSKIRPILAEILLWQLYHNRSMRKPNSKKQRVTWTARWSLKKEIFNSKKRCLTGVSLAFLVHDLTVQTSTGRIGLHNRPITLRPSRFPSTDHMSIRRTNQLSYLAGTFHDREYPPAPRGQPAHDDFRTLVFLQPEGQCRNSHKLASQGSRLSPMVLQRCALLIRRMIRGSTRIFKKTASSRR